MTTPTKVFRNRDRRRRAAAVRAHRARHGDWCPGFERAAHRSADLTADHAHELQAGGRWDGPLEVLCRPCNSRKARRTQVAQRARIERAFEDPGGHPLPAPGADTAGEGSGWCGGSKRRGGRP